MGQLQDLQEEEREAAKQAERDALTKSIEAQVTTIENEIQENELLIEENNEIIDSLDDNVKKILTQMLTNPDNIKLEVDESGIVTVQVYDTDKQQWVDYVESNAPHNAEGGLVDYTGPAWVDGTPSKPEAFLSAADTKNMELLLNALQANLDSSIKTSIDNNDISDNTQVNVSIGQVDIHTDELNNNQDFADASQIFATEFANAIQRRGLNLNVKK